MLTAEAPLVGEAAGDETAAEAPEPDGAAPEDAAPADDEGRAADD